MVHYRVWRVAVVVAGVAVVVVVVAIEFGARSTLTAAGGSSDHGSGGRAARGILPLKRRVLRSAVSEAQCGTAVCVV